MFLKIYQNSQENTCARASFLLKKRLWHRCFPVNFAKILRTPFFKTPQMAASGIFSDLYGNFSEYLKMIIFYICWYFQYPFWPLPGSPLSNFTLSSWCFKVSDYISPDACNFIKKESPTQVVSCEFCEILRTRFFYRTSPGNCSILQTFWGWCTKQFLIF